jgi:hypothetical protein
MLKDSVDWNMQCARECRHSPTYAISENKKVKKVNNNNNLGFAPNGSLSERNRSEKEVADEYCWAVTGGGAVM